MNEEYEINEKIWGYDPDWGENCLRRSNNLEPYRTDKSLCKVCLDSLEIKPKKEIPTQPNVLHIQRKIFI